MSNPNFPKNDKKGENSRGEGRRNRAAKKNAASINHLLEFQLYRDLPEYRLQHQNDGSNSNWNRKNYNRNRPSTYTSNHSSNYTSDYSPNYSSNYSSTLNLINNYDNGSNNNHGRPRGPRKKSKAFLHGMRFINVNYKFIVDYRKPYTAQKLDPNVPVDTEDILCIVAPQGNACPICLSSELVAPRMITSCGHILCLPCLLALLDSEVPTAMKRESKVVVEKYTDCPLCASVIRRGDVRPVLVDTTDVRFDMPKVKDEVVLTLMARESNRIVPVPSYMMTESDTDKLKKSTGAIGQFPWADQLHTYPYLRIYKSDHTYVSSMYEREKAALRDAYENDSDLFLAGGKLLKLAIQSIDEDIRSWAEKFDSQLKSSDFTAPQKPAKTESGTNTFFYYQTGFKCLTTYVLSLLDMKVLKMSYGSDYSQLPPSIVAKVENIHYEEMDEELATTRYKYMLHLPLGTQLGFLECCWEKNEYITEEAWVEFKLELMKRSKMSLRKSNQEEKSRQRAIKEEERRAREYIDRENNGGSLDHDNDLWMNYSGAGSMGSLAITDYREMPALSGELSTDGSGGLSGDAADGANTTDVVDTTELTARSVWGTRIPKSEVVDDLPESWDAEDMIRRAREEIEKQEISGKGKAGKKKKKKYILLLSNSGWA